MSPRSRLRATEELVCRFLADVDDTVTTASRSLPLSPCGRGWIDERSGFVMVRGSLRPYPPHSKSASADTTPHTARKNRATFSRKGRSEEEKVTRAHLHCPPHRLRHPHRDQRRAGVLPAGAHHARRSAGGGAAGRCVAGTRRAIAHGLRLRPSAAGAVRAVAVARAPWRSRQLDCDRAAGVERSAARGPEHRDAGDRRGPDRLHARPACSA